MLACLIPGDHRVRGESMSKPEVRSVGRLNEILGEREWLVGDSFSVADVACASYLNYVPIFHRNADLSATPNTVRLTQPCDPNPNPSPSPNPNLNPNLGQIHAPLRRAPSLRRGLRRVPS